MMKIKIVEDTLTKWADKTGEQIQRQMESILKYATERFYDNLSDEVPIAEDNRVTGYEGGSLYESGGEEFWIIETTGESVGITMDFSGSNNPYENRVRGGWKAWLPDKPYGLYQYYKGKQNTLWLEKPLNENEEVILRDVGEKYWEVLTKGE